MQNDNHENEVTDPSLPTAPPSTEAWQEPTGEWTETFCPRGNCPTTTVAGDSPPAPVESAVVAQAAQPQREVLPVTGADTSLALLGVFLVALGAALARRARLITRARL